MLIFIRHSRGTQRQFSKNTCSEDDSRSRIFGTFVVKFLARYVLHLRLWIVFVRYSEDNRSLTEDFVVSAFSQSLDPILGRTRSFPAGNHSSETAVQ